MSNILSKKIDFALIFSVHSANPNGDPLNGNRPRETNDGYGEVSDVCLKRKIRNRLIDLGQSIFVQSDDRRTDDFASLNDRAKAAIKLVDDKGKERKPSKDEYAAKACKTWIDVRSFGQVFAFKGDDLSVGVRGPVSIHPAYSVTHIDAESIQITKSVNSVTGDKKSSDTMGMKHRVPFGLYVTYGSINCQLAEKTGFTDEDADLIKKSLAQLFENDTSSARPDGSMEVVKFLWWQHNSKLGQYSSAAVHRSLKIDPKVEFPKKVEDYDIKIEPIDGLTPEDVKEVR